MSKSNKFKPQEKRIKRIEKRPEKQIDRELKRINKINASNIDDVLEKIYDN
jgi:hypothetical protein